MQPTDADHLKTLMKKHGIATLFYEDGTETLSLSLPGPARDHVKAPAAGLFLLQHPSSQGQPVFPRAVKAGDIVGYIKTGWLLRPVRPEKDCRLLAAKQPDGTLVGFGEPLYDAV